MQTGPWVLIVIGLLAFSPTLMGLFGPDFRVGWPILVIGAVGQLVNCAVGSVGIMLWMSGNQSVIVRVQILDCADAERFDAFTFNLSAAVNGVISRASSRISIVDNDTVVPTPQLFVRDAVVDEKDGNALVSVLLGGTAGQGSNSTVTVHYATANGTANSSDYTSRSGTLSFAPGETAKTVVVPITDDGDAEGPENFSLNLSNARNADIATGTGTVTIGASDTPTSTDPDIRAPADL